MEAALLKATKENSWIESFLEGDDIDINYQDRNGRTPLSYAAEKGHWWSANRLLKKTKILADSKDKDGRTPLSYAAEMGHQSVVTMLLKRDDVDPNSLDNYNRTPLSFAAEGGHDVIVADLFERDGILTNPKDKYGRTPLSYAAEKGHQLAIVELLKSSDIDVDSQDDGGRTPLSYAAANGHEHILKVAKSPDIAANLEDHVGRTPLSYAAKNGHLLMVKKLLSRAHVSADSKDKDGRTPLSYAAENGNRQIVEYLLEWANVAANSVDKDGRSPLIFATKMGHESIARSLLKKYNNGAADLKDVDGRTPLSYAAEMGHWRTVYELSKLRYVVRDSQDKNGRTPLSYAVEKSHSLIEHLLSEWRKFDINFQDKNGWTLLSEQTDEVLEILQRDVIIADRKDEKGRTFLSYAAEAGRESVVTRLLSRKDVNASSRDNNGRTPLSYAAERGYSVIVFELLMRSDVVRDSEDEHGRTPLGHWFIVRNWLRSGRRGLFGRDDIALGRSVVAADLSDKNGRTPLSYAAEKGHELIVNDLLRHGGVVANSVDKDGRTPLSYAAEKGHESIVNDLLRCGGVVAADLSDKNGRTPLSYAAEKGHELIVNDLLRHGGVVANSVDKDGRTPLSYAAEKGHKSIVEDLLKYNGVVADSKAKNGRTPLSYAAEKGHEQDGGSQSDVILPSRRSLLSPPPYLDLPQSHPSSPILQVDHAIQTSGANGKVTAKVLLATNAFNHVSKRWKNIVRILRRGGAFEEDFSIMVGFLEDTVLPTEAVFLYFQRPVSLDDSQSLYEVFSPFPYTVNLVPSPNDHTSGNVGGQPVNTNVQVSGDSGMGSSINNGDQNQSVDNETTTTAQGLAPNTESHATGNLSRNGQAANITAVSGGGGPPGSGGEAALSNGWFESTVDCYQGGEVGWLGYTSEKVLIQKLTTRVGLEREIKGTNVSLSIPCLDIHQSVKNLDPCFVLNKFKISINPEKGKFWTTDYLPKGSSTVSRNGRSITQTDKTIKKASLSTLEAAREQTGQATISEHDVEYSSNVTNSPNDTSVTSADWTYFIKDQNWQNWGLSLVLAESPGKEILPRATFIPLCRRAGSPAKSICLTVACFYEVRSCPKGFFFHRRRIGWKNLIHKMEITQETSYEVDDPVILDYLKLTVSNPHPDDKKFNIEEGLRVTASVSDD